MAVGTERFQELWQSQMESLQMLWSSVGPFLMHIVAGGAANITDSCMARILVENGHFTGCFRADGAAYGL